MALAAFGVGSAWGCDACRRFGMHLHGNTSAGGDSFSDGLSDPEDPSGAASFVVSGSKWPQAGGLGSPVTLTYSFQNMFDGGLLMPNDQPLPKALIRRSIEEALGVWASVAPLHFVEVFDNGLPYSNASAEFGQIRFRHIFINGPDPAPPAQPIAKAQAFFPSSNVLGGDVEYDHGDRWQEVGTLSNPDLLGATIHELGHSLGLNHSNLPEANMFWIFTRTSGLGTGRLHPDDIAGMQAIYGVGSGTVTSLVPEPASVVLAILAAGTAIFSGSRPRRRPVRSVEQNRQVCEPHETLVARGSLAAVRHRRRDNCLSMLRREFSPNCGCASPIKGNSLSSSIRPSNRSNRRVAAATLSAATCRQTAIRSFSDCAERMMRCMPVCHATGRRSAFATSSGTVAVEV